MTSPDPPCTPAAPMNCPGCGHDFHPAGNCLGIEAGHCSCHRNMAVHLDITPPSALPHDQMTALERRLTQELELVKRESMAGRAIIALLDELYPNSVYADVGNLRLLVTERDTFKAQLARLQQQHDLAMSQRDEYLRRIQKQHAVIEAGADYYRLWRAGPSKDGCPRPVHSGSHDDHACMVSLHARLIVALKSLDATEPYRNEEQP